MTIFFLFFFRFFSFTLTFALTFALTQNYELLHFAFVSVLNLYQYRTQLCLNVDFEETVFKEVDADVQSNRLGHDAKYHC